MLGERHVTLTLTVRAREQIGRWVEEAQRAGLKTPIPGLDWGRPSGVLRDRWGIAFWDRDRIDRIPGWLCHALDFEFVIVQEWVVDKVDNKVLDIDEKGQITIKPRENQEI